MFAQVFPWFQEESKFRTVSLQNPGVTNVVAFGALGVNIAAIAYIAYRAKKLGVNPYKSDVFVGKRDWEQATTRREDASSDPALNA
jgi:hypothetical protein